MRVRKKMVNKKKKVMKLVKRSLNLKKMNNM